MWVNSNGFLVRTLGLVYIDNAGHQNNCWGSGGWFERGLVN